MRFWQAAASDRDPGTACDTILYGWLMLAHPPLHQAFPAPLEVLPAKRLLLQLLRRGVCLPLYGCSRCSRRRHRRCLPERCPWGLHSSVSEHVTGVQGLMETNAIIWGELQFHQGKAPQQLSVALVSVALDKNKCCSIDRKLSAVQSVPASSRAGLAPVSQSA